MKYFFGGRKENIMIDEGKIFSCYELRIKNLKLIIGIIIFLLGLSFVIISLLLIIVIFLIFFIFLILCVVIVGILLSLLLYLC